MEYKWNTNKTEDKNNKKLVLILVLMEYKWNSKMVEPEKQEWFVLILVLMEYKWNDDNSLVGFFPFKS